MASVRVEQPAELADIDQLFRRLAHAFEGSPELIRKHYRYLLKQFFSGQTVIDLGCGNGIFLEELAKRGVTGIGVEIDPARVAECEAKGLKVYREEIQDFVGRFSEQVDGVVLTHVIEHLDGKEALTLLAQSVRLLRPRGKLIVVTPNYAHREIFEEIFWLDITHKRPYPLRLLRAMMETLDLEVIDARVAPWSRDNLLAIGRKREEEVEHGVGPDVSC